VRPATPGDRGYHGCNLRRNVGYFRDVGNEAWAQAQREVVIAVMIEKVGAVEQIEEILSIHGVDMITFGPGDYSVNIGKPGGYYDPEVQRKQRDIIELAIKKGVRPRAEVGSFEEAKEFFNMGVRDFSIGTDLEVIFQFCKQNGEKMRELLASG
jgi:4-hydroxy-2-oxoheptanedioate aldolase